MTDLGFFELLVDGFVESIEAGARTTILMIAPPPSLASLGTRTLRVEVKLHTPMVWASDDRTTALVADLLKESTLRIGTHHVVPDADPVPRVSEMYVIPKSDPEKTGGVGQVSLHGTLVAIHANDGRRIKVTELQWATVRHFQAASKLPTTAELKAKQTVGFEAVRELSIANGFMGRPPFFHRENADVAQALVLVPSRWNTRFGLSFHVELVALVADLRGRKLKNKLDMFTDLKGPLRAIVVTAQELAIGNSLGAYEVNAETDPQELAARVVRDFSTHLLPWLDSMCTPDAIDRANIARSAPLIN
jgi:hypothetical protein